MDVSIRRCRRSTAWLTVFLLTLFLTGTALAQQAYKPSVEWRSLLNMNLGKEGYVRLEYVDLVFAPAPPLDAQVVVKTADGKPVAQWEAFPDYGNTGAVFARMKMNPRSSQRFPPGSYVMEFVIGGQVATRMPFDIAVKSKSDDPFNPGKTLSFDGPWQDPAYLTFNRGPSPDKRTVEVHYWAGTSDLPKGMARSGMMVELHRNGTLIGHSRTGTGPLLANDLMGAVRKTILTPHERGDPKARNLALADFLPEGDFTITVKREADGATIRTFPFKVLGGKFVPLARCHLNYEPHADFIAPRTLKQGTTSYEFVEAVWLEGDN